ncbi:flavin reductase [Arthrobacter sp. SA17]
MLRDDLDPSVLRTVFGQYPSGVAALCGVVDGSPEGIVASTFTVGVSLDPPLVLFAAQNSSLTWPLLRRRGRIGVSVLAAGQGTCAGRLRQNRGPLFRGCGNFQSNRSGFP